MIIKRETGISTALSIIPYAPLQDKVSVFTAQ